MPTLGLRLLRPQGLFQPGAFFVVKPGGFCRRVSQDQRAGDSQQQGGQALSQENPLPARETEIAVQRQQIAANGAANDSGGGAGGIEHAHRLAAMPGGEPLGQEERDAREEPGLRQTQQEADGDKTPCADDHRGADRAKTPGDHDHRDPAPRAYSGHHHVGGHLEQHIAPEECSGAEAIRRRGQTKRLVHRQGGEGNIESVQHVDQVGQAEQRQKPPNDLAHHLMFQRAHVHVRCHGGLPEPAFLMSGQGEVSGAVKPGSRK